MGGLFDGFHGLEPQRNVLGLPGLLHHAHQPRHLAGLLHAAGQAEAARQCLKHSVTIYAEIGTQAGTLQPEIWKLAEW